MMNPDKGLSLGLEVSWSSQAGGYTKTKRGTIVAVILPGELPDRSRFLSLYKDSGVGSSRDHVSYVVAVEKGKGKPRFYWPRTSALRTADS